MIEEKIITLLNKHNRLKAREIARRLNFDRKGVNRYLHSQVDIFNKDDEYFWSLSSTNEIVVEFEDRSWIDCSSFEQSLAESGCLLSSNCKSVLLSYETFQI